MMGSPCGRRRSMSMPPRTSPYPGVVVPVVPRIRWAVHVVIVPIRICGHRRRHNWRCHNRCCHNWCCRNHRWCCCHNWCCHNRCCHNRWWRRDDNGTWRGEKPSKQSSSESAPERRTVVVMSKRSQPKTGDRHNHYQFLHFSFSFFVSLYLFTIIHTSRYVIPVKIPVANFNAMQSVRPGESRLDVGRESVPGLWNDFQKQFVDDFGLVRHFLQNGKVVKGDFPHIGI